MRALAIALVLAATVACGAYRFPGSGSGTGSVSGHVLATPCAPVQQKGQPCPGRPVAGVKVDFQSSSGSSAEAITDSAGHYQLSLEAGTWNVTVRYPGRVVSGPPSVTVAAGASVVADYVVDSGIR